MTLRVRLPMAHAWLGVSRMAGSERPESWPGVPGLTAEYLAAEDIDISVVLRGIGLSQSRIDTGIRALETVRAANVSYPPFMFRLGFVIEFARALKLPEEGLGSLEKAAFVPLILALLGRGAGALSTFTHVDLKYLGRGGVLSTVTDRDLTCFDLDMTHLEELKPFPLLDNDMTASLCTNLGHQSSKVTNLCLGTQLVFGNDHCCEMLAAALRSNRCLKDLRLPLTNLASKGVKLLVSGLKENQTLEHLEIGGNYDIGDEGTGYVAELLKDNMSLDFLDLFNTGIKGEGAGFLSTALARNTKLRTLRLGGNWIGKPCLTKLLEVLTPASDAHGPDRPNNTTLIELQLSSFLEFPVESMALMIERNTSLIELDITKAPLSSDDWVRHIIPALKRNSTLRVLNANGSEGVTATGVFEALVDLLKTSNTALELIDVYKTPLSEAGMVGRLDEELLRNKNFRHAMSLLPKAKAKSCRVVLCGREYAGKSTLCEALFKLVRQQRPATGDGPTTSVAQVREQASLRDMELDRRTSGISINVLTDEAGNRISVWDFAGHREFHALHQFIFPSNSNAATQFVLAVSPIISPNERVPASGEVKTLVRFEEEVLYWLRFIASNTGPGSAAKPSVVVVITNRDRLADYSTQKADEVSWLSGAENVVSRLEAQFRDLITLQQDPCIVNARDVEDDGLNKWVHEIQESFKRKLAGLEAEPEICSQVVKQLDGLTSPIMSTAKFADMCKSLSQAAGIPYAEGGWRPVAAYLQDVGEVMYHEKLDFIITNPRWFGHGVLGNLVDPFSSQARYKPGTNYHPRNGFINKRHLSNLLEKALESVPGMDSKMGVQPDQLIQLLMLLDLCYEASPGDPKTGYLFPALFGDEDSKAANGMRPLTWYTGWKGDLRFIHVGRRLECADRNRTMLTDGFYPRLQVVLRKHALEKWDGKETVEWSLEKNLFRIRVNSMEILVEYSGFSGYFVDILVKSSLPHSDTVKFVHENFVTTIRESCASQEGCPGVTLSEAIIRPACFQAVNPILCAYRKDQATEIDELTKCISSIPDYRHSWPEVRNEAGSLVLLAGSDSAISLLNGELASLDDNCYPGRILTDGEQLRGAAVIISMEKGRPGGSVDRGKLEVLAKRLGFVAYELVDCEAEDLLEELKHIAAKSVVADDECFVCFVNAHGNTNELGGHYIIDKDQHRILLDEILAPCRTCKQLRGKPKVFFVNSCRGISKLPSADNPGPSDVGQPPYEQPVESSEHRYVEDLGDTLVAFSTSGESASARHPVEGTTFVTALVEAFDSKRHTTDVYDIIKNVNYAVLQEENTWMDGEGNIRPVRQCPIVVSSLTKRFFLR